MFENILFDFKNDVFWIVDNNKKKKAFISYDDKLCNNRYYYLVLVNEEYDNNTPVYHYVETLYQGIDFEQCKLMSMNLI